MDDPVDELTDVLYRLSELLLVETELSADLRRTASIAAAVIEGCDRATVSLVLEGRPTTLASTDRVVLRLDLVQYEHDDGPCLDSARTGEVMNVDLVSDQDAYPYLASAANEHGITGVRSHPVVLHDQIVGSMNLYSRAPDGFPDEVSPLGDVLAAQVALALEKSAVLATAHDVVADVQATVDRRDALAHATGVLMAIHQCSAQQARRLMQNASDSEQRALGEVASLILSSLTSDDGPLADTTGTDLDEQRRDADPG